MDEDNNKSSDHHHKNNKKPGSDRLKRDEWSEGAVSTLLEAYEAKWVLRNRAKLKGHDWEEVAHHVSSRENSTKSAKTQTQCKNKIESMKKRYRSESATPTTADASSWPFYSRLHLLLRGTGTGTLQLEPPFQSRGPNNQPGFNLLEPSSMAVSQPPPLPLPHHPLPPPPPPPITQNSHGSNGLHRLPKEDDDGLGTKSSDQVSNKNNALLDTDSSTPALYSCEKERVIRCNKRKMKSNTESQNNKKIKRRIRKEGGDDKKEEIAESIRWLAEVVVRSEQTRMETMKEIEKMRIEAEAKRGELDLKRTEIIANTQIQIATIFATLHNKPLDSSLTIGRT